jgi:DNA-binding NarL/FixJ family response regulator
MVIAPFFSAFAFLEIHALIPTARKSMRQIRADAAASVCQVAHLQMASVFLPTALPRLESANPFILCLHRCREFPYNTRCPRKENPIMANDRKAKVLIVDSEPVARFGLLWLIGAHKQLQVCAQAETPALAREACVKHRPDIVVVDAAMCGGEGFALLAELPRWCKNSRAIVFTALEDVISVQRALQSGAFGYVTKRDPMLEVIEAILRALSGKRHLGPRAEDHFLNQVVQGEVEVRGMVESTLSGRELQVFRLLGNGHRTRDIADELNVSVKTVESHIGRIKAKMDVKSNAQLRANATRFNVGDDSLSANGGRKNNGRLSARN